MSSRGWALMALSACAGSPSADPEPERPVQSRYGSEVETRELTSEVASPDSPSSVHTRVDSGVEPEEVGVADGYFGFRRACATPTEFVVAAVGDLLLHRELARQAMKAPDGFRTLWSGVEDLLGAADVTYANLEGPTAWGINRKGEQVPDPGRRFDNSVYSGYAKFNYHPSLAQDLVRSGIDVVSTANNHALDRGPLGVDRTLEALEAAGLPATGTRKQAGKGAWEARTDIIVDSGRVTLAWVACTKHTNFAKDEGRQVMFCYRDRAELLRLVEKLAADDSVDVVIATPHWGQEYEHEPTTKQRELAQELVAAGAMAVIGSHPHVLQSWETIRAPSGHDALVFYSLGNFASHQRTLNRRTSVILYVGWRKSSRTGEWIPSVVRVAPLHVRMEGDKDKFFVESIERAGGPEPARELVHRLLGDANDVASTLPLEIRPRCTEPHP